MGGITENGNGLSHRLIDGGMKPNRQLEKPKNTPWKCAVLKDNTYVSLSPFIHTEGYKAVGVQKGFVYRELSINPDELGQKIKEFKDPTNFYKGISVGVPFKGTDGVMRKDQAGLYVYLDAVEEAAEKIGAVNTIVVQREQGKSRLVGTNTDVVGFVDSVKEKGLTFSDKKVIIYGAGGASRASIYGALQEGASSITVAVRNLTSDKAMGTSNLFSDDPRVKLVPMASADIRDYDIIVNTIPLHDDNKFLNVPVNKITKDHILVEWKYSKELEKTELEEEAEKRGAQVISGRDILLHQAKGQFELYTEKKAPLEVMRQAVRTATKT